MQETSQTQTPQSGPQPVSSGGGAPSNLQGSDNVAMRILCYFSILVLIPLLVAKDSDFIQFHAKQGLVLLVAQVATWVIAIIPVLGWVVAPILSLIWFILAIVGIINAVGGKKIALPIIGGFAKNF